VGSDAGGIDLCDGEGGKEREKKSGETGDASAEQESASRLGTWL